MRDSNVATLLILVVSLASFVSCGQAPTANKADVGSRGLDEQKLVKLMDRRIAVALADWDVTRQIRAREASLAGLIAETGRFTGAQLQGRSSGGDEAMISRLNELARRVDERSSSVREAMAGGADLEGFEARLLGAVEDLQATQQEHPEYGDYFVEPEPGGGERVPFLDRVTNNMTRIAGIVGQLQGIKSALDEFRSSGDPAAVEDYVDYEFPEDFEWDYGDETGEDALYEYASAGVDGGQEEAGNGSDATVEPVAVGVLATREFGTFPGVTVEILRLERTPGKTVTLEFALNNASETEVNLASRTLFGDGSHTYSMGNRVALMDMATMTAYTAAKDNEGRVQASGGYRDHQYFQPGERREFWVRFPEPPTSVISLVFPDGPPFDDMRISG